MCSKVSRNEAFYNIMIKSQSFCGPMSLGSDLEVCLSVLLPCLGGIECLEGTEFGYFPFPKMKESSDRVVSFGEQGFVMGNAMGNIE